MKRFILFVTLLAACGPKESPPTPAPKVSVCVDEGATFEQVRPIFAAYCADCHPSRSAPNWQNYSQTMIYVKDGTLSRRLLAEKSMPPPGSLQARNMTRTDRNIIARWIETEIGATAAKNLAANLLPGPIDVPAGAVACLSCHGVSGPRAQAQLFIPRICGQNMKYLVTQMQRFRWLDRLDPTTEMNHASAKLGNVATLEIAKYFSQAKSMAQIGLRRIEAKDRPKFARGQVLADQSCNACHMNNEYDLSSNAEVVPLLFGQSEDYLTFQLSSYQKGLRKNRLMQSISQRLTNEDILALALYYSTEPTKQK